MDRLKALKINESYFSSSFNTIYVHDPMSHVSWLSAQFCIYMLKLRFFQRGSRITVATPSPLVKVQGVNMDGRPGVLKINRGV